MSPGKHSPALLSTYVATHNTILEHYRADGFISREQDMEFEAVDGVVLLHGVLECLGGIAIEVDKRIGTVMEGGSNSIVKTESYRYHAQLRGVGPIFRYESAHSDHQRHDHVHRFGTLLGDAVGDVTPILDEEAVPTLGEVIDEAREWYCAHYGELLERGLIEAGGS